MLQEGKEEDAQVISSNSLSSCVLAFSQWAVSRGLRPSSRSFPALEVAWGLGYCVSQQTATHFLLAPPSPVPFPYPSMGLSCHP